MKGLDDLTEVKDISLQDILANLLDGDHDLDLKTQVINPKDLAVLKSLAMVLNASKLKGSGELINSFINIYLRYMISYNRKSREEVIKAVSGLLEMETVKMSMGDRLTTNLK